MPTLLNKWLKQTLWKQLTCKFDRKINGEWEAVDCGMRMQATAPKATRGSIKSAWKLESMLHFVSRMWDVTAICAGSPNAAYMHCLEKDDFSFSTLKDWMKTCWGPTSWDRHGRHLSRQDMFEGFMNLIADCCICYCCMITSHQLAQTTSYY